MSLSPDYIRTSLQALYGESVTSAEIRGWCAMNDTNYQTVTNKLSQYKVGRGKWNLEVTKETVQDLEVSYSAPAAMPAVQQNLIPEKMIPSSSLAISVLLKKLFSPVYSIHRSLLVSLETVKHSRLSKRVLNWVGNSSV